MNMLLTERQIDKLSTKAKEKLLYALYLLEDETDYKLKKISNTINYLQQEIDADLCYEIYNDIYLDGFYGTHEETDEPVCFEEFYNNEWKDPDCKEWYMSIYKIQNQDNKDEEKERNKFFTIKHILEDWFGTQIEDGENDAVIYQILDVVD